jgi:hypothetical protein
MGDEIVAWSGTDLSDGICALLAIPAEFHNRRPKITACREWPVQGDDFV